MEGWWLVGLALSVPWLVSAVWLRLSWGQSPAGIWPMTVGYSYILGSLAVALLLRLQAALGFTPNIAAPLAMMGLLAIASGWFAWRQGPSVLNSGRVGTGWREQPLWRQILFVMLLAWLGWRLAGLALEIWWRPLYPWDAWTTWTVRPKVWAELSRLAPFVDPARWLADPKAASYTIEAWTYPATVPLLVLWPTLAFGGWNETAANLPWFGAALGLGFGFYGQARLWGATPLVALIFTWLLLSLPMLDTHIALAGYADLWMTAIFSLAALAFFQWVRGGDRRQGFLALLLAAACPLIKLEGTVWLALFVPALVVIWLRGLWLWLLVASLVLLGVVWWSVGGVSFTVPGLGEFRLRPDLIKMPYIGQFNLVYRGTWGPVLKNFLVLANWHLLWYLGLAAAVAVIPALYAERWRRIVAVFVGSCLSMLFVLFFLTDAQRWAEEYTSINRVFLHCVPALLFWIMTVFIPNGEENPAVSRTVCKPSTGAQQPFV